MRNKEERAALIRQRTAELKAEEARKKYRIKLGLLGGGCAAACLAIIIELAAILPQAVVRFQGNMAIHPSGTATMLTDSGVLGYVMMGILAFFLGVCVTVLLHVLHRREQRRKKESGQDE